MPFQPVEAAALVELVYLWDGQICENTLYFDRSNDYLVGDLAALSGAIVDWWVENMAPLLSADLSLTSVKCTALHDNTGPQFINTTELPALGTVAVDSVPNNVAPCISFRTALIGRSFRGRNYLCGVPETSVAGSRMDAEFMADVVAAYSILLDPLGDSNRWIVVSRTVDHSILETALRNAVLSVQFVDNIVDSQKRRLPGRGN
jgi:hypothetical protein